MFAHVPRSFAPLLLALAASLAAPAAADTGDPVQCSAKIKPGARFAWTTIGDGGVTHAQGQLTITKVDGTYFEALQTGTNNGTTQTPMYGAMRGTSFELLLPKSAEDWQGDCFQYAINGTVKGYVFTFL